MKVKEESKKVGLKLNIQKMKIMASSPISSWEIDGETVETVSDFMFLGSKITADGDCSHEIKRRSLLGRKVMSDLDSVFKSRDIPLPTKVCLVKAMVFSGHVNGNPFQYSCLENPMDRGDWWATVHHLQEPPKIKSDTVSTVSPSISYVVMGPDAMILVF